MCKFRLSKDDFLYDFRLSKDDFLLFEWELYTS